MIEFKSIRWKNFLSYGDHWTEVSLNGKSQTLVVGDNGAGKSTMIDALCYALYGKAFRRVVTAQLINSVNSNHMLTEVEFRVGKTQYKVIRGLKPRLFEVYQNDSLMNQEAHARDYQEVLEKNILKINHKSFTQIVVLGSTNFVPFMQLQSKDRKEVIEDLLDIGIFSVMSMLLKDKTTENKNWLSEIEYKIDSVDTNIARQKEHIEYIEKKQTEDIAAKKGQIDHLSSEINQNSTLIDQEEAEINSFLKDIPNENETRKKLTDLNRLESQLENKFSTLKKEIDFYENNDVCPTCGQNMDDDHKHSNVTIKGSKAEEVQEGIDRLKEKIDSTSSVLETTLDTLKKVNDHKQTVVQLESDINAKKQVIDSLNDDIEQKSSEDISTQKNDLENLQKQLVEHKADQEGQVEVKELYSIATKLLKDTGIKSRIIKQYVPVMNKLINKYLAAMDFFVQYELDENFDEKIKSRFRDEFSYASFSEGEKMRIDLALLFTWRAIAKLKNSASTNLLIMDEVFDSSLDTTGTDEFLKILKDLTSDTNVFIISHKTDQLIDKFPNVLRFEKHRNFSRMIT
jgi:DNA repair exonuclease SbcCD ATPase subunit